mmetsp:Transcript_111667/g.346491  ORF Transcript_111667/g.346491 Transcript_111667/m.346491 type:complete len:236 (+) Transcript_111667:885-1592(+)
MTRPWPSTRSPTPRKCPRWRAPRCRQRTSRTRTSRGARSSSRACPSPSPRARASWWWAPTARASPRCSWRSCASLSRSWARGSASTARTSWPWPSGTSGPPLRRSPRSRCSSKRASATTATLGRATATQPSGERWRRRSSRPGCWRTARPRPQRPRLPRPPQRPHRRRPLGRQRWTRQRRRSPREPSWRGCSRGKSRRAARTSPRASARWWPLPAPSCASRSWWSSTRPRPQSTP